MKMKTKKSLVLLLCGVAALAAGCRQNELDIPDGKVLKAVIEGGETRTSFDSYEGKFAWTPDDQLAVYYSDGTKSIATVAADGTVEVPASTASRYRDYYAVYPASVVEDINDGSQPLVVTLPNSYDISDIVANASGNPGADFSPLPMVAQNDEDNDILMFYHVGGLLRVTLNGVKRATKYVCVTFDKDVTGTYTVANPGTNNPTITTLGNETNNAVTFTLTSDAQLTAEQASGPIVLNVPVPCGSYDWVKVECLNSSNTAIASKTYDEKTRTFQRHHGKRLSDNDLAFEYIFQNLNSSQVTYKGTISLSGTTPYAMSVFSNVRSYKINRDTNEQEKVPWTLEFSEDDGETWTTTLPAWLYTTREIDLSGTTSSSGNGVYVYAEPQTTITDDEHRTALKAVPTRNNFDLSTINVATGATVSRTTANCYVVQGPGTYKFPLVYGNGVIGGEVNESAFHAKSGITSTDYLPDGGETRYLGRFKDHLDNYISSPYIATQQSGKTLTAALLWSDEPDLVTNVNISGSGEDAYITFRVPKETIAQGNAVVAVLADGVIAWSWQIWVTDEDLTVVQEGSNNCFFAPVNLGWCDLIQRKYPQRSCRVRATQINSGKVLNSTITQLEFNVTVPINSPFYQWGRKDPMPGHTTSGRKQTYPSSSSYTPNSEDNRVSIGEAIQHPFTLYSETNNQINLFDSDSNKNLWDSTREISYSAPESISSDYVPTTKTIYDPSPVGYKVPPIAAWRTFTTTNFVKEIRYNTSGRVFNNEVWFAELGSIKSQNRVEGRGSAGMYFSATPYHFYCGVDLYFFDSNTTHQLDTGPHLTSDVKATPIRPILE